MPFVAGFLRIRRRGGLGGGHPDQGLPEIDEPDGGGGEDIHPDQGLPEPPPGIWPPLTPSHPIQPAPPGTPPGAIWPPVGGRPERPVRPDQGLPGGGPVRPDQGLPVTPPAPDQGLPERPKVYWVVAGIPGVGWRYVAVDPAAIPPRPEPK
jgi:hypothetical protein